MHCTFHKKDGRLCNSCSDYEQIKTRILSVKLGAVGDVLHTISILPALKRKYERCEIIWLTRSNVALLFEGNVLVDRLLRIEEENLGFILNEEFDVGICLDVDQLSATIHSLASCKVKFRFVADKAGRVQPVNNLAREWWLMGLNDKMKKKNRKTYQQIIYEICNLANPVALPMLFLDNRNLNYAKDFARKHGLNKYAKVVGINTGCGSRWRNKRWTQDGYVDLIYKLWKLDVEIILFGEPEEVEFNTKILEKAPLGVIDADCSNSLREFAALINLVDVLFTPDSLGMHIAVALEKHVIVYVGPTSPWELDVYGKGEVIHSNIECLSCYHEYCDKEKNCMNMLISEFVFEKVVKYI